MAPALELKHEIVLLCEGDADRRFFEKLIAQRGGFPPIDIPFVGSQALHGNSTFDRMLKTLEGDLHGFSRIKGVLIVADSAGIPRKIFEHIRDQIIKAQGYPVPSRALEIARRTAHHPAVSVMLLPDEINPGGLETLFAQAVMTANPWVDACVETFLRCDKIRASGWSPEKRDKARYHSMVAALHEDDPSRAAAWAFRNPPVFDIAATCFNGVERRLRDFCAAV